MSHWQYYNISIAQTLSMINVTGGFVVWQGIRVHDAWIAYLENVFLIWRHDWVNLLPSILGRKHGRSSCGIFSSWCSNICLKTVFSSPHSKPRRLHLLTFHLCRACSKERKDGESEERKSPRKKITRWVEDKTSVYQSVYVSGCVCVCMYVGMRVYGCVCVLVYVCMCVFVCMYVRMRV